MAAGYEGNVEALSPESIADADLVIDAIFGAGLNRPIASDSVIGQTIHSIQVAGVPVLAADVPSGLNGDTGEAGGGAVLTAKRTVTFFRRKPAHLLAPGRYHCGRLDVVDIGIPPEVLTDKSVRERENGLLWSNAPELWCSHFQPVEGGHKYAHGHTLVVSGSLEMSGAARLAARGALRAGSGLVTVASPSGALAAHGAQLNAIMLVEGQSAGELARQLEDHRKNSVVIGPGLGLEENGTERLLAVLSSPAASVLDADALTIAATARESVFSAFHHSSQERPVVLTPHEGEFVRLFPAAQGSKLERARAAAAESGAVIVLKGPDTVIAAPDQRAAINENAPPWLATAGSGDVLAGMIGGLLARSIPPFEAACAAVYMHGAAASAFGRGLIAEDLPEQLPGVWHDLAKRSAGSGGRHASSL